MSARKRKRRASPQTLYVLDALLARPRSWHYGYQLSQETGLPSGTLYPILHRLHERGALATRWRPSEHAGRPARQMVKLTGAGLRWAREAVDGAAADGWSPAPEAT